MPRSGRRSGSPPHEVAYGKSSRERNRASGFLLEELSEIRWNSYFRYSDPWTRSSQVDPNFDQRETHPQSSSNERGLVNMNQERLPKRDPRDPERIPQRKCKEHKKRVAPPRAPLRRPCLNVTFLPHPRPSSHPFSEPFSPGACRTSPPAPFLVSGDHRRARLCAQRGCPS